MRRALLSLSIAALALLAPACGSGGSDGSGGSNGGSDSATTTSTTEAQVFADLDATQLTFNPVLAIVACEPATLDDTSSSTTTTTIAEDQQILPSSDGTACYLVGPAAGDGTDIRDAKVYADGVGIEVQAKPESAEELNAAFNACFAGDDSCPAVSTDGHGYLAIVADGVVLSAPQINGEDLASSPFVITGKFDQEQANNLAHAINGY